MGDFSPTSPLYPPFEDGQVQVGTKCMVVGKGACSKFEVKRIENGKALVFTPSTGRMVGWFRFDELRQTRQGGAA